MGATRQWPLVLVPALLAVVGGAAVGLAPELVGPLLVAGLALVVMLTRLEIALGLVVAALAVAVWLGLRIWRRRHTAD